MYTKWIVSAAAALLLAACSSPSLKETPYFTQDYGKEQRLDPHRVIVPPFYYRDPKLIVFPVMEFGPKYVAVRPVYSASDRDTDHPVYSVLWPIAKFDPSNERSRIFPVYWGDEYFNVLPLYWHEGDPFSGAGRNALIPVWMWNRTEEGHYLGIFWPLYSNYEYPHREGWWLWPAHGNMQTADSSYRYFAWPFLHSFTTATGSGHLALPLWYYGKTDEHRTFVSLPYSRSLAEMPGGASWDLALPLWYRAWNGDASRWMAMPALSWGKYDANDSDIWLALGIGRYGTSPESMNHHVIPLYLYSRDSEARRFYTLPWWSKKYADGTGWNMMFPVYYHGHGDEDHSFYSLPWLYKKRDDGSGWHTTIPLYYRGFSEQGESFYSLPWLCKNNADGTGWHTSFPLYLRTRSKDRTGFYSLPWSGTRCVDGSGWHTSIPFYFHSHATNSSAFYSPVWLAEEHADGSEWQALFPVYFGSHSDAGSFLMTPVYARKLDPEGATAWRCYIPFVYFNDTYDSHFLTVLGGRWKMGDNHNWLALPLLSGGARDADSGRTVWLAGLAGNQWDEHGKMHYCVPFYYFASPDTVISLPYVAWRNGERRTQIYPLFLSGSYGENEVSGGLVAGGLYGYRKGGGRPFHYVFPLYYADQGKMLSLPYARWEKDGRTTRMAPPLLSGWYREDGASGGFIAAGLAGYRYGDEKAYSYLFPLYYFAPERGSFLSLPYTQWQSGVRQNHMLPLLLSGWSSEPYASDVILAGGLAAWRREQGGVAASHILPFYMHARDEYLYTLPFGRNRQINYYATPLAGSYRGGSGKSGSWVAPMYWYRRTEAGDVRTYYFPLGYYRKKNGHLNHGFMGIYDYQHWTIHDDEGRKKRVREGKTTRYLFALGQSLERWEFRADGQSETSVLDAYRKDAYFFPAWYRHIDEDRSVGERVETSAVLGPLYATRHEQKSGDEERDYFRRSILWLLYRYERLNGDVSVDALLPGITVDSYRNGYYKFSLLWRLFRYEKDPDAGSRKIDVLFLPLKR